MSDLQGTPLVQDPSQTINILTSMPVEILDKIVANIYETGRPRDLKNVRLICEPFPAIAGRYMFREISVWLSRPCLKRLVKIAECKNLGSYVQELRFGCEYIGSGFPDSEGQFINMLHCNGFLDGYTRDSRAKRSQSPDNETVYETLKRLRPGWSADSLLVDLEEYKAMWYSQSSLFSTEMDVTYLTRAFARFRNLRRVIFHDTQYGTSWGAGNLRIFTGLFTGSMAHKQSYRDRRQISSFVKAASATGLRVHSLEIDASRWFAPESRANRVRDLEPCDPRALKVAFGNVTSLKIWDGEFRSHGYHNLMLKGREQLSVIGLGCSVSEFLQNMSQVNDISLDIFQDAFYSAFKTYVFSGLIEPNFGFQNLQTLKLLINQPVEENLERFMNANCKTIKNFCLESYKGYNSVKNVCEFVKRIAFLESFTLLYGGWDSSVTAVTDYMLGRRDSFPDQKREDSSNFTIASTMVYRTRG